MKKLILNRRLVFFTLGADAEIISITGKIVKEGTSEGVAGVRISLKNHNSWITEDIGRIDTSITNGVVKRTPPIKTTIIRSYVLGCKRQFLPRR